MKFICNNSTLPTQETADMSSPDKEQEEEEGPLVVIPYVARISESTSGMQLQLQPSLLGETKQRLETRLKEQQHA